ncbi:hypothetical protein [Bradyrhizobium ottawaense]
MTRSPLVVSAAKAGAPTMHASTTAPANARLDEIMVEAFAKT